jgi:hypothetical protein
MLPLFRVFAIVLTAAALLATSTATAQTRLHVDPAMVASGDGFTWATAYKGIKSAVAAAVANPAVTEIWVKEGTYYPGTTPYSTRDGLAIFGGFAGTETSLAQRDLVANETILTGQDAVRVIGGGSVAGALFDGFTIRDGRTDQSGALVNGGAALTFRRCKFLSSRAGATGGVYANYGGSVTFVDCRFSSNEAGGEGSVASTYDGAMTFVNCRLYGNIADGAGVIETYEGTVVLVNTAVCDNTGPGGGGLTTYEGSVTAIGCTFSGNTAFGLSSTTGTPKFVRNCVFGAGQLDGPSDVAYSLLADEVAGEGNIVGEPLFSDTATRDFRLAIGSPGIDAGLDSAVPDDDFDLDGDGIVAEPVPFDQNGGPRFRAADGGAKRARVDMGAFEHFPDCNRNFALDADDVASGTSADLDANGVPDECEDCNGNDLPDSLDIAAGTSIDCQEDGIPDECQQATITRTYKVDDGSAENTIGLTQASDIAWLNRFTVIEGGETLRTVKLAFGAGLPAGLDATVCVWGDENQDGDPRDAFLKRAQVVTIAGAADTLRDYDIPDTYLGPAGTRFFVGVFVSGGLDALAPLDQTGASAARSWVAAAATGTLDLEAIGEASLFGLIDSYGIPGNWLVRAVATRVADCNQNGTLDECDIADGVSADCQRDGIPDECQLTGNDCNANGIPDDCELASGTANDCQPNGIPDACELASGSSADIDANGVPDECEDCNANGLPDSIDIANGAEDCQGDGIPDACQLGGDDEITYRRDDGSAEVYVSTDAPNMAWLSQYTILEGGERIGAIDIMHALMPIGFPVDVYLWSDPNGDGDPTDARVLAHVATKILSPDSGTFERVELEDVYVGEAGTSFFVGAIVHNFTLQADYPGAKHTTSVTNTSWLVGKYGTIDPNDLSADNDEFLRIDDLGGPFVGVWCIRAVATSTNDCNLNGIPDDCDIADGTSVDADGDGRPDECFAPGCVADLDDDGTVGASDLSLLLASWGASGAAADLDGDGDVGASDLSLLLAAWGGC